MNEENLPEAQYSIYKISFEEIEETFEIKHESTEIGYEEEVINALICSILKILEKRPQSIAHRVQYKEFNGVVFKTINEPNWKDVVKQMIDGNEYTKTQLKLPKGFLTNSNISYVLFYVDSGNLFAITGGYGSIYIKKFINKNFGLYLLPKLVKRDNPVLRQIVENNLIGNQISTNRANRKTTSFLMEQDMSNIFRQLCVEIDRDVADVLGITFQDDEPKSKKINIINKDSLVIRRSFTLYDLKKVLSKIKILEHRKDNFALNYLVLAKKRNIKNCDLLELLVQDLQLNKLENFVLVGDEYQDYYINADDYLIMDGSGNTYIRQREPITLLDIFSKLKDDNIKLTKSFLLTFLKHWTVTTFDNSGNIVLYPITIFDALQGFVEYNSPRIFCYLFNGSWYVFDYTYEDMLLRSYQTLFDIKKSKADNIKTTFKLQKTASSEDIYNRSYYNSTEIIVTQTALISNIEISDLIYWNDNTIYLMHK